MYSYIRFIGNTNNFTECVIIKDEKKNVIFSTFFPKDSFDHSVSLAYEGNITVLFGEDTFDTIVKYDQITPVPIPLIGNIRASVTLTPEQEKMLEEFQKMLESGEDDEDEIPYGWNPYKGLSKSFEDGTTEQESEKKDDEIKYEYCKCENPLIVISQAAGESFEYCRKCKNEKK